MGGGNWVSSNTESEWWMVGTWTVFCLRNRLGELRGGGVGARLPVLARCLEDREGEAEGEGEGEGLGGDNMGPGLECLDLLR